MKIKIVSDGSGMGTKVINTETGQEIPNVYKAEWSCDASGFASIILHCRGEAELEASEGTICFPDN